MRKPTCDVSLVTTWAADGGSIAAPPEDALSNGEEAGPYKRNISDGC